MAEERIDEPGGRGDHGPHPVPPAASAAEASIPAGGGWSKLPWIGGGLGVVGLGAAFVLGGGAGGAGDGGGRFYPAYLVAFLYFLSLALGGLFFVLLHHLTRAGWSVVVRRLAEHVAATLPLFALLFVPLGLGLERLYPWAAPGAAEHDALLAGKGAFLNPGGFWLRAAIYLAAWCLLAWWFRRSSLTQDRDPAATPALARRMQTLSAPAMILFAVTLTFASFDWAMSLDPHWYSTIFGVYFFSGCAVGIYALLSLVVALFQRSGMLAAVTAEHRHDLGKLLFAFVVFWAYIGFSQYLLIWYGNIPEETIWYLHRSEHGWLGVTMALAIGHFGLPFFVLLSREVKRRRATLAAAAVWMLAFHALDLYWLVMPALSPASPAPHPVDLLAFVGVGGLFAAALGVAMRRPALVPVRDPRLPESLSFENI